MAFIKRSSLGGHAPAPKASLADLLHGLKQTQSPDQRRETLRALSQYPEAVPSLLSQLQREEDTALREALFMSLIEIGDAAATEGLAQCLRSEDVGLRNEAIDALRNLPQSVPALMASLLKDPEPDVRIFALNILESLRHPQVEAWLLETITQDPHVNVCATAVDLLGEVGSVIAIEPLKALKARFPEEPYIQFAADIALKRLSEG